jgi:hypothetical protein
MILTPGILSKQMKDLSSLDNAARGQELKKRKYERRLNNPLFRIMNKLTFGLISKRIKGKINKAKVNIRLAGVRMKFISEMLNALAVK